jgi:hypothetical protein
MPISLSHLALIFSFCICLLHVIHLPHDIDFTFDTFITSQYASPLIVQTQVKSTLPVTSLEFMAK